MYVKYSVNYIFFIFICMKRTGVIGFGWLTLFLSALAGKAQELPHFVEKLTVTEGLSSNVITGLAQDDNGFLWIASSDGLDRFDGTETIHYRHGRDSNSLPHNYVNCILKLPGHFLVVGTMAGLSFYNTSTGVIQNFYSHHQPALDLYNNSIEMLCVDSHDNCWAASRNCIYIFDPHHRLKKIIRSGFTENNAVRERLNFVEKMLPQTNGDVLLGLHDGWACYSARSDSLIYYQHPPPFLPVGEAASFPAKRVFPLFASHLITIPTGQDSLLIFDEQGRVESRCFFPYNKYPYISWSQQFVAIDSSTLLILLHNFGLIMVKLNWNAGHPGLAALSPLLFDESEYQSALRDRQGNWWLATAKEGLQKIAPTRQYFMGTSLIDRQTAKPVRYEVTSCNRRGGKLWVCTYGNGFFEIDLPSGRQIQHRLTGSADDTWANFVWNISFQGKDTLFVGTQIGLFAFDVRTGRTTRLSGYVGKPAVLDSFAITTQFADSHGILWMGLGKGRGCCTYDPQTHQFQWYPGNTADGYPLRYPTGIVEDGKGDLWFTNDASCLLLRWHRSTRRFIPITLPAAGQRRAGPLRGICCQSDSLLWVGDVTGGLLRYDLYRQTVAFYGRENGLSNSHITDIYEDTRRRLWLITEGGLVCFDPRTETFSNFTAKDGLPVPYPSANFFFDTTDHRLYTGGPGSYFSFDPSAVFPGAVNKRVLITALQVNGIPQQLTAEQSLVFSSQQNYITIQYAAIDLIDGPSTNYLYRLIGADSMWMKAGRQRQLDFSHLPPGKYTFQVRAATPDSAEATAFASLGFRIEPPFTQTPGFYALLFLVLAGGGGIVYGYRKRQLNRARQIRSEISRNLHDEVGANLSNISLSSLLAQRQLSDQGAVQGILERIYQDSQLVSESMREIVWSINPQIDTLGEALPRMLHFAAGLLEANSIELQARIDPEVEQLRLTMVERQDVYLILKESINNIVRHSKATIATVEFEGSGKHLTMRIRDNGNGFDPQNRKAGNGLGNLRARAHRHRWRLAVGSVPGQGTTIVLETA